MNKLFRQPAAWLWLPLVLLAWLAQRWLAGYAAAVETIYANGIFRWLAAPLIWLNSRVPFSLTEAGLVFGVPLFLAALGVWLVRLARLPQKKQRLGRGLRLAAWLGTIAYLLFMLLHGLNYDRLPVAVSFSLPVRDRSADELAETAAWLFQEATVERAACREDAAGVFRLRNGVRGALAEGTAGYRQASKAWPLLTGTAIRPKGVLLSRYWSYTGITGLYCPIIAEANINIDQPDYTIPDAIGHEIAHTRGFAREDEAGFISFLSGLAHPDADYRYSVLVNAAVRLSNALNDIDPVIYRQVMQTVPAGIWRDLAANNAYWQLFAGPVRETSDQLNNAYLQANLQTDGVRSYGRMIDLVLAWYDVEKAAGRLPAGS